MTQWILTQDRFSGVATALRKDFENRFENPRDTHSGRFVWDYWHVPNQYTLLRTPAYHYFEPSLYSKLHHELVHWGRRHLGCWDISPPWLSCYVEGCKQELHSDVPHGAWAYVFSLSPRRPLYRGGETMILRPEVLNYWQNFASAEDRERNSFLQFVSSPFNRLTVFDPRLPHGVTELRGTHDPREGRLVVHGWFTQPKTYLDGYLPEKKAEKILNQAAAQVSDLVGQAEEGLVQGTLAIGLKVSASGQVRSAKYMTNTVVDLNGVAPANLLRSVLKTYRGLEFPRARGETWLTVPLILSAE